MHTIQIEQDPIWSVSGMIKKLVPECMTDRYKILVTVSGAENSGRLTRALVFSKHFTNTAEISVTSGQYATMAQISDTEAVDGPYKGSTCSRMNTNGLLSLITVQLSASVPD